MVRVGRVESVDSDHSTFGIFISSIIQRLRRLSLGWMRSHEIEKITTGHGRLMKRRFRLCRHKSGVPVRSAPIGRYGVFDLHQLTCNLISISF